MIVDISRYRERRDEMPIFAQPQNLSSSLECSFPLIPFKRVPPNLSPRFTVTAISPLPAVGTVQAEPGRRSRQLLGGDFIVHVGHQGFELLSNLHGTIQEANASPHTFSTTLET